MKILAGAAGIAAAAGLATPAAAQYYPAPNYGYNQGYNQGYNNNGGVLGAIVNQVLGYGRYPYGNYGYNQYSNQSTAVNQCARAVEARIGGGSNGNWGYQGYNRGYGYNQGYNNGGRVLGITRVDRKSYGLKVYGVASSGYNGYSGYGRSGYGNYGYNAGADLSFNCEVRYDGRIRDIDVNRRTANWRGY
jgi:opacity protein-like surface antigen